MIFTHLATGSSVFFDANTLIYHFTADPIFGASCRQLVQRIHQQQLSGFTATHVLTEVAHRLMGIEAMQLFGWPAAGIARRLRQHPAQVQQLALFRQAVEEVPRLGIQILPIPSALVASAAVLSQQTGLLTNDALIVAVMQANGLIHLASNDGDFDRVPGLTRYAPV